MTGSTTQMNTNKTKYKSQHGFIQTNNRHTWHIRESSKQTIPIRPYTRRAAGGWRRFSEIIFVCCKGSCICSFCIRLSANESAKYYARYQHNTNTKKTNCCHFPVLLIKWIPIDGNRIIRAPEQKSHTNKSGASGARTTAQQQSTQKEAGEQEMWPETAAAAAHPGHADTQLCASGKLRQRKKRNKTGKMVILHAEATRCVCVCVRGLLMRKSRGACVHCSFCQRMQWRRFNWQPLRFGGKYERNVCGRETWAIVGCSLLWRTAKVRRRWFMVDYFS